MPTLEEFFHTEAGDCLARIEAALTRADGVEDAVVVAAARQLRGIARLARADRVSRLANLLQHGAGVRPAPPAVDAWESALRFSVDALRVALVGGVDEVSAEALEREVGNVWRSAGAVPGHSYMPKPASTEAPPTAGPAGPAGALEAFAAAELQRLAGALQAAAGSLRTGPEDLEPLRTLLIGPRRLLGAAGFDRLAPLPAILSQLVSLGDAVLEANAGAPSDMPDVLLAAAAAVASASEGLATGGRPGEGPELDRFRSLADAAARRLGDLDTEATPSPPAPPADDGATVAIDSLCYHGSSALHRALELRDRLTRISASDPAVREVVDELFDLIRLGLD